MASLSEASEKLRRFKRDLVADLFVRRGAFWEMVQEIRAAWKITPTVGNPPVVDTHVHYPSHELEQAGGVVQQMFRRLWLRQVFTLRDQVIPETYRVTSLSASWTTFLSACLLYDPPETHLLEFACCADLIPTSASTDERVRTIDTEQSSNVPALPIILLPDPFRARDDAHWYRDAIIDEIGKQFLEPRGLDIWEMFHTVIGRIRDYEGEQSPLGHEYAQRQLDNEPRPYIFVTEETTEEDIKKAFRSIKASQRHRSRGGRPTRDRLVAIQCAIFYDRHNSTDPSDLRRKKWSLEKVAEKFGLESTEAAEGHIELGRKELSKKNTP